MPHLVADGVDVDVAPLQAEDHEFVRMLIAERETAIATLAAPTVHAKERGGEGPGGERLPGALGSGEHVGVMGSFGRAAEERHRGVLSGHLLEDHLHVIKTNDGRGRTNRMRGSRGRLPRAPAP